MDGKDEQGTDAKGATNAGEHGGIVANDRRRTRRYVVGGVTALVARRAVAEHPGRAFDARPVGERMVTSRFGLLFVEVLALAQVTTPNISVVLTVSDARVTAILRRRRWRCRRWYWRRLWRHCWRCRWRRRHT